MAAPVKALVDPVGFLRQAPADVSVLCQAAPPSWGTLSVLIQNLPPQVVLGGPVAVGVTSAYNPTEPEARIPTPPMGRIHVNTFPPIYRERVNRVASRIRPAVGQIWPDPLSLFPRFALTRTPGQPGQVWP